MSLLLFLLAALSPLRLFEVLPQKLTARDSEIQREAILFASMSQISTLSAGEEIEVPTAYGIERYRVLRVSHYVPGTMSLTAVAVDELGGHIAISMSEDKFTGLAQSLREGTVELFGMEGDIGYRAKVASNKVDVLWCGTDAMPSPIQDAINEYRFNGIHPHQYPVASPALKKLAAIPAEQDSVTIDLMLVYTPKARDWANASEAPGSMDLAIAQAMNLSQQALDVSHLAIKLRLVHTHMTDYTESEQVSSNTVLRRLTASPSYRPSSWGTEADGYMDEVHTLRDQYGADVVAMLADVNDTGGVAWLLNNHSGNPLLAFSLNRIRQTHFTYTLIHEIGHNMGNDHGRNQPTAAADVFGGLNPYSTGFRWRGADGQGFATVMQYTDDSYPNRTPYFSSPDMQVGGKTIGVGGMDGDASDNQRSMREIRRVISEYRDTKIGNPNFSITPNLSVDLESGESTTLYIDLENRGETDAMWRVHKIKRPSLTPVARVESPTPTVIFSSGFEDSEGFAPGQYSILSGWRTFNEQRRFQISREKPQNGQQHIRWSRIPGVDAAQYTSVQSPQFGNPAVGHYRASFDFALSSPSASRFYVYFNDALTGEMAGGVLVDPNGMVYTYRRGSSGNKAFYSQNGWSVSPGNYHRITFEIDPQTDRIRYKLNNLPVWEAENLGGYRINYIEWLPQNSNSNFNIDLDNIRVEQDYTFLPGLQPEKSEGTLAPGQIYRMPVHIDTHGLNRGTYQAEMEFMTSSGLKKVTMEIIVDGGGSSGELPEVVRLEPNYPNPFNPTTALGYSLGESNWVRLTVYDVLGRQVAKLVDQEQQPGYYEVQFDAANLASGVYIYRIEAGSTRLSRKMMLIK